VDFVGREDALARVRAALEKARLVTITGTAGVGKSALAREVAAQMDRPCTSVDASAALDANELLRRVARAADVGATRRDVLERLAKALDDSARLVVIDDIERTDVAREAIEQLLARTKRVSFLATSRAAIGLTGEDPIDLAPLSVDEAISLFQARASFDAAPPQDLLRAIADRLEGLPLAIVLAAGRSRVLSPADLLARLDEPLRVLRGGSTNRHATLERAIDSSWAILGERERQALVCAALFEGTFSADGFEAVFGERDDALDALEALLSHSLIEHRAHAGAVRFRMLHGIRAFGSERMSERADRDDLRARYEAHVESAALAAAAESYGARAAAALDSLERMQADILAAFETAFESRPARAAALWLALFDAILFRSVVRFDDPRFSRAVAAADRTSDDRLRARTRILRARASLERGPPESAEADLRAALSIAEGPGLPPGGGPLADVVAEARRSLGWMELGRARPAEATRELEAALAASIALHDTRGHADALAALGLAEQLLGRGERAVDSLRLARALHESQRDAPRAERVDDMLKLVDPRAAERFSPEALRTASLRHEEHGQPWRLAVDLALLADLEESQGSSAAADELRVRARASAREGGLVALERALAARAPTRAAPAAWIVPEGARSIVQPDGTTVDLSRYGSVRRVLDVLVGARLARPGQALTADEVLEAGWPGEKVLHDAGLLRVYSTIRRLRRMGFSPGLITRDDGYLLDPSFAVTRG
jgi:predicted ATPase